MRHLKTLSLFSIYLCFCSLSAFSQTKNARAWDEFVSQSQDNVLLDFSYAGYKHGLVAPPDITTLNYKVYDITDPKYGGVANDGKSDRKAFESIVADIESERKKRTPQANAIIYFPEGEFILHDTDDNVVGQDGKEKSQTLNVIMGHVILKGAGRDKTFIRMASPMLPTDEKVLYSSPVMLSMRHNGKSFSDLKTYAKVVSPAVKNDMAIEVDGTQDLKKGDWIQLYMANSSPEVVRKELNGLEPLSTMKNLLAGVVVVDYHQIKEINGNTVILEEPIMHNVDPADGWHVLEYPHYEGVGIEDMTFIGDATAYFHHHNSWQDDGAYKPLNFVRMTNSWVRRVNFRSISECITFQDCANVSCYDVEISGNRGHSAVRMANSSRGFIGNVYDHSDGYKHSDTAFDNFIPGLGQYHACGISKHSIGNVVWNCQWGSDACFESHATQPRASLFDCCKGGFMQFRMGGALEQLPNHLDDLTIWNFNCTETNPKEFPFQWWIANNANGWYRTMPPTVVGFHGKEVIFAEGQMKRNDDQGFRVSPHSLYEAQLERRLGNVPDWLVQLKGGGTDEPRTPGRTWDFTSLSVSDRECLEIDVSRWAMSVESNGDKMFQNIATIGMASSGTVEAQHVRDFCGALQGGGRDLEVAKGLKFGIWKDVCKPLGTSLVKICVTDGKRSLRLGADKVTIVIPDCKRGQQVVVRSKSVTSGDARHLQATNLEVVEGFCPPANPKIVQESWGTVQQDGDVILTTVNGNHIYDITLKTADGNMMTLGIDDVSHAVKSDGMNACYNLAGQRVSQQYHGIVIRNGKKYMQK